MPNHPEPLPILVLLLCLPALGQHGSTTVVNPYTGPEHAREGAKLYRAQCASCHGLEGRGAGAAPSLTSGTFRYGGSDEALFRSITKGVPGTAMSAFALTGLQTWQLVTHVRALGIVHGASQVKGDSKAGAEIFRTTCSGCHMVNGQGGLRGPDLSSVGAGMSIAEMRSAITDPDAAVPPAYWTVVATKSSGQTIRGVRLNEDTYSIQLRADGKLVSLLREDLKHAELVRKSPMPSFEGKLSPAQLDDVIAYLVSLRGEQK
ncbi:MAG TPA: c-type cytochrome [Bryobacteraceae bacterium]|nr:c-type cytochrome [Bryobacteraceae bacterium]